MDSIIKKCSACKVQKDIGEFHKDKSKKDGYYNQCKECKNKNAADHRNNNKEKISENKKIRYRKNIQYYKNYRDTHMFCKQCRTTKMNKKFATKNICNDCKKNC
jgi:hypothetical protein